MVILTEIFRRLLSDLLMPKARAKAGQAGASADRAGLSN